MSFKALLERHSKAVLNVALRILRDSQKAHDVHQEVFFAIWRRWHKFDDNTNWGAYLYRAAVRKAIESAKQSRTEPVLLQQCDLTTEKELPDSPLRAAELQQDLIKCLGKLPRLQADAFVLSRLEGLGHRKVAEILGCSYEAVGVHLHRAVKRLSKDLSHHQTK
jgi:RNA polymerase sigma-70 factor (ECF subfamily)